MIKEYTVLDRVHVTGRGYVTVIKNKDLDPIDTDSWIVNKEEGNMMVREVECMKGATGVKEDWGILTQKETKGETIFILI